MAVKELSVGNLNIVFIGEKAKYDLLDFWDEFVNQVFDNDVTLGKAPQFLLKDIKIGKINKTDELAICGRYVKSTVLSVKQVLKNNELVPRDEQHESAPSAVFIYLLRNHVLLYWGEFPGYPSVNSFKIFLYKNIEKARKRYLRVQSKGKKDEEKLAIINKYPQTYANYIPLPLTKTLESQFSDLTKINRLFVRQYYQNANIDYNSVLGTNQSLMNVVKSQRIDWSLVGISDIEGTKELVSEIVKAGDSDFVVDAKTKEGKKKITNDGVQYSEYIYNIPENSEIKFVAEKLFDAYSTDVKKGNIPAIPQKNSNEILKKVKRNE